MVKAKLDDVALTADEALTLSWFNTITSNHIKLHAFLNWGINNEAETWKQDSFVARSSLVACYNNVQLFWLHMLCWILSRME